MLAIELAAMGLLMFAVSMIVMKCVYSATENATESGENE